MNLNFSVVPDQNGKIDGDLIGSLAGFYAPAVYNYYQNLPVSLDIYQNYGSEQLQEIVLSIKADPNFVDKNDQEIANHLREIASEDQSLKNLLLNAVEKYSVEATKNIGARIGKEATESEFSRGVDKLIVAKDSSTDELVGFFMFRVCNEQNSTGNQDDKKFVYIGQACVRQDLQKQGIMFEIAYALTDHLQNKEQLDDATKLTYISRVFNNIAVHSVSRAIEEQLKSLGDQRDQSNPIVADQHFPASFFGYQESLYKEGLVLELGKTKALLESKLSKHTSLEAGFAPNVLSGQTERRRDIQAGKRLNSSVAQNAL